MYYFMDIICSIAEIIFLSLLASGFFQKRNKCVWVKVLSYICFGLILIGLSLYPEIPWFRTIFWAIGGPMLVWVVYDTKILPSLFVGLAFLGIGGLAEISVMAILSFLNIPKQALLEIGNVRILYTIISHVVILVLIMIVRFCKGIAAGSLSAKVLIPVCPCFAICVLFCLLLGSDISHGRDVNPFYLIIALGLLYISIVIVFYTVRLQEQENFRRNLELANHHYAMQKEYYEQFHSQQEQTQALWHDIKKYIRAVEAESGTIQSLEQLQHSLNSITSVVDVKNRVVSIILNEYVRIAADAETKLALDVHIPSELPITVADLYIILGNTLDNALDACESLPKEDRKISFQLRLHNQMLFYRISNPYALEHLKRKRTQFHGYGLKNVRECVTRNSGSINISTEDNTYMVTVLLNCP